MSETDFTFGDIFNNPGTELSHILLDRVISLDSYKSMREMRLKTDNNSYMNICNEHEINVFSVAYEEGYDAGFKHCLGVVYKRVYYPNPERPEPSLDDIMMTLGSEAEDQMLNKLLMIRDVWEKRVDHMKNDNNSYKRFTTEREIYLYEKGYEEGFFAGYKQAKFCEAYYLYSE